METIQVTLTEFIEGKCVLVDEHPIVNDDDYCEIVELSSELHYTFNGGGDCKISAKKATKNELIQKLISRAIFDTWFEENMYKTFNQLGLDIPIVYDHEEDKLSFVNSIDDYYYNCKSDENYDNIIQSLQEIAAKEYDVEIIDMCGGSDRN